jgi:hypothetical protein
MEYLKMKTIVNCETGEIIERELTEAEIQQQEIDEAAIAQRAALIQAEAEEKATARQAILDRLGISAEEAQLLLGGN